MGLPLVVHRKPPRGRKDRNRLGKVARRKGSRQAAAREREPWLIVASPELDHLNARQLVALYGRRMQIEMSFRDLNMRINSRYRICFRWQDGDAHDVEVVDYH